LLKYLELAPYVWSKVRLHRPSRSEHVVAPRSDQPTGDLAAAAHRVLIDSARGGALRPVLRQGIIHLGVCTGRALSPARGTAESEAFEMPVDLGTR
jgi:hypothetical protein